MVAAPFKPTHALIVQGPITKTHDVALARTWWLGRGSYGSIGLTI
jgi:hypothetical protein